MIIRLPESETMVPLICESTRMISENLTSPVISTPSPRKLRISVGSSELELPTPLTKGDLLLPNFIVSLRVKDCFVNRRNYVFEKGNRKDYGSDFRMMIEYI